VCGGDRRGGMPCRGGRAWPRPREAGAERRDGCHGCVQGKRRWFRDREVPVYVGRSRGNALQDVPRRETSVSGRVHGKERRSSVGGKSEIGCQTGREGRSGGRERRRGQSEDRAPEPGHVKHAVAVRVVAAMASGGRGCLGRGLAGPAPCRAGGEAVTDTWKVVDGAVAVGVSATTVLVALPVCSTWSPPRDRACSGPIPTNGRCPRRCG